jgi:hypothetical protein
MLPVRQLPDAGNEWAGQGSKRFDTVFLVSGH